MSEKQFDVRNPATEEIIETLNNNSEEEINEMIENAHHAFQKFKKTTT